MVQVNPLEPPPPPPLPLPACGPDDASPWYETILVGKNKLSNMVEEMCEELQVFWFAFFVLFCCHVQKWNALVYRSLVPRLLPCRKTRRSLGMRLPLLTVNACYIPPDFLWNVCIFPTKSCRI